MIKDMFTVYDAASKTFCTPFFSENITTATRAFAYAANDPNSEISRFPSDYSLFHFGTFDDQNAEITTVKPYHLCNALQHVKQTSVTPTNEGVDYVA